MIFSEKDRHLKSGNLIILLFRREFEGKSKLFSKKKQWNKRIAPNLKNVWEFKWSLKKATIIFQEEIIYKQCSQK